MSIRYSDCSDTKSFEKLPREADLARLCFLTCMTDRLDIPGAWPDDSFSSQSSGRRRSATSPSEPRHLFQVASFHRRLLAKSSIRSFKSSSSVQPVLTLEHSEDQQAGRLAMPSNSGQVSSFRFSALIPAYELTTRIESASCQCCMAAVISAYY